MNEIIHTCDTLSVVFKVILRKKLLGSVTPKLGNIYLSGKKEVCLLQNLCDVCLSEVLYTGEVSKCTISIFYYSLYRNGSRAVFFHLGMRSKSPNALEYSNQLIN